MAKGVLIVGSSGTGKSTSVRNLNPEETFLINVQGKPLPFVSKGYVKCAPGEPPAKGNIYVTDRVKTIKDIISYISTNRPEIKSIVIDDTQYCAVNEFMRRIDEKGFSKFNDIGHDIWRLPQALPTFRDDLVVYFLYHDEMSIDEDGRKYKRAKQMGKLIDQQVGGIEGYFTYVLFTEVKKENNEIKYSFVTNNEGDTTAKTPMGMFELRIPNDLNLINQKLLENE